MAYDIGSVVAKVKADTTEFQQGIKQVTGGFEGLGGIATKLGLVLGGVFAVKKIADFGKEILTQAGNFEQYLTGFEVLLDSMEKAKDLMGDLTTFAKKTPFRLEEVVVGSKQLLAYGFAQEDVVKNMKMLGNVASALKVPMGDMVYLYGTLRAQGRAYTRDIIQFSQRGLPVWQMLADEMGKSVAEVQDAVSAGEVTFETVSSAMNKLAGENGKWGDMMDKQSATMMGKLSNLQDAWQQLTVTLGNIFLPVATQVVDWITNLITQVQGAIGEGITLNSVWQQVQMVWTNVLMALQPLTNWFTNEVLTRLRLIWAELKYFVEVVVPPVVAIIKWLIFDIIIPWMNAFVAYWKENWDHVSAILKGAWDFIVGVIKVAWAIIAGLITTALLLLTGQWTQAWDNIKHYAAMAWGGIKGIFNGIISFLKGWGGWLWDELTAPFRRAWDTIQDIVRKIKDALDFTKRHSPSVVDIVEKGVSLVNRALGGLTVGVEPIDTSKLALNIMGGNSAINNINISMAGAYIGDETSANRMAELMGDSIIRNLQKHVRF